MLGEVSELIGHELGEVVGGWEVFNDLKGVAGDVGAEDAGGAVIVQVADAAFVGGVWWGEGVAECVVGDGAQAPGNPIIFL